MYDMCDSLYNKIVRTYHYNINWKLFLSGILFSLNINNNYNKKK
jgi:hypothetical protein